jgi:tRNA A37 threonylcarbamoyltransferase TsaD
MAPLRLPSIPKSLLNTPDPSTTGLKSASAPGTSNEVNTLRMNEEDIQQTAKFVREFVSMSLVPWMEKCVADWNENVIPSSHIPGPVC